MQYLVVVRPFGSYRIGDVVTDATEHGEDRGLRACRSRGANQRRRARADRCLSCKLERSTRRRWSFRISMSRSFRRRTWFINGVPTNIVGIVGTASWGPVNQPVIIGDDGGLCAVVRADPGAEIRYGHAGRDRRAAGCAEFPLRAGYGRDRYGGELRAILCERRVSGLVDGALQRVARKPDRGADHVGQRGGHMAIDAGRAGPGRRELRQPCRADARRRSGRTWSTR